MLEVALGEYDIGWHDPAGSLRRAGQVVQRAADSGARLVVLPEMTTTGFTMDSAGQAESLEGPSVAGLREVAARGRVHLLAGVATREQGNFYNSALLIDPGGALVAHYRKQRLFVSAREPDHYTAGDRPVVVEVEGVRLAPFICFDLRFPELFREVAPRVDALLLIANWPAVRRPHWDVLTHARAIENQCYFVAVNRVGSGGGVEHDGGSVAYDPWGERVGGAGDVVVIDPERVGEIRGRYPFVEDRRLVPQEPR